MNNQNNPQSVYLADEFHNKAAVQSVALGYPTPKTLVPAFPNVGQSPSQPASAPAVSKPATIAANPTNNQHISQRSIPPMETASMRGQNQKQVVSQQLTPAIQSPATSALAPVTLQHSYGHTYTCIDKPIAPPPLQTNSQMNNKSGNNNQQQVVSQQLTPAIQSPATSALAPVTVQNSYGHTYTCIDKPVAPPPLQKERPITQNSTSYFAIRPEAKTQSVQPPVTKAKQAGAGLTQSQMSYFGMNKEPKEVLEPSDPTLSMEKTTVKSAHTKVNLTKSELSYFAIQPAPSDPPKPQTIQMPAQIPPQVDAANYVGIVDANSSRTKAKEVVQLLPPATQKAGTATNGTTYSTLTGAGQQSTYATTYGSTSGGTTYGGSTATSTYVSTTGVTTTGTTGTTTCTGTTYI